VICQNKFSVLFTGWQAVVSRLPRHARWYYQISAT